MLIQRMVLSIRSRLTSDEELRKFVSSCVSTLPDAIDADTKISQLCKSFDGVDVNPTDVIHALNCFESTEEFSTEFVTTGTVLFSKDNKYGERWWVCVEPACDTVPSQASSKDNFLQCRLLEVRNCTAEKDEVVKFATRSRYIFVKFDSNREFLDALNKTSDQPKPVTAFVPKENQLSENRVSVFLPNKSEKTLGFSKLEMRVVAQLQEPYANRLLQETGNQLSRIGLNFINLPDDSK